MKMKMVNVEQGKKERVKEKATGFVEELVLPDGITASISGKALTIKGRKGETSRRIEAPNVTVSVEGNKVVISAAKGSKREKKVVGSLRAHVANMLKGVSEEHVYKLKLCYTHFPITVTVSGNQLLVKNLLGEKVPRKITLRKGVNVKVEGSDVIVESADKEIAGQTAAAIEQITRRANYDRRVFGDGIYITSKGGKEIK